MTGDAIKYKVWFFAGGETGNNKFNVFTGSFIRMMKEIMGDDFDFIRDIYFSTPMTNVIWALNNAQKPVKFPDRLKVTNAALRQIVPSVVPSNDQLIIISSSTGSIAAAQAACYLAEKNSNMSLFSRPFHLVLGASMVAPESELYCRLLKYKDDNIIGKIIHEEIQDEGDNTFGVGGVSRKEAWRNAFGLILPVLSSRYNGPSFLNTHTEKGHIHRRRSQSVQKAIDYVNIILVKNELAGELYREKALKALEALKAVKTCI
jgi:hypothetical protein